MEFSVYYGQNGMVKNYVQGIKDYHEFYGRVSGVVFSKDEKPREMLAQMIAEGIFWGSKAVFCILHELDDVIMDETDRLAAGGVVVVIYVVTDRNQEDYIKQNSERRKIIVIPIEAELEGVL